VTDVESLVSWRHVAFGDVPERTWRSLPRSSSRPVPTARVGRSEAVKRRLAEPGGMKNLIVHGDPGIRKGAVIEYDGEEHVCYSIQRQGDYHGPDRVQLWCTIGTPDEAEAFEKRQYVPHWLDVESVDADALTIVKAKGDLAI
jgi:hypothetical protein